MGNRRYGKKVTKVRNLEDKADNLEIKAKEKYDKYMGRASRKREKAGKIRVKIGYSEYAPSQNVEDWGDQEVSPLAPILPPVGSDPREIQPPVKTVDLEALMGNRPQTAVKPGPGYNQGQTASYGEGQPQLTKKDITKYTVRLKLDAEKQLKGYEQRILNAQEKIKDALRQNDQQTLNTLTARLDHLILKKTQKYREVMKLEDTMDRLQLTSTSECSTEGTEGLTKSHMIGAIQDFFQKNTENKDYRAGLEGLTEFMDVEDKETEVDVVTEQAIDTGNVVLNSATSDIVSKLTAEVEMEKEDYELRQAKYKALQERHGKAIKYPKRTAAPSVG